MSEKKEVNEPLSATYADAKTSVTLAVRNVMKAFPLPIFMFESILSGLLGEIRSEANMELSSDIQRYKDSLVRSHQAEVEELTEKYEKEGFFGNVVFSNGAIDEGDNLKVYYGAADDKVALAEGKISDILKWLKK